ncbi:MAG: hypothetical protein N3G20_07035, partial [Verrucomicrobiae bacterium]|nr:hypothetical protein [Verrucomicrobiae bacterium]
VGFGHLPVIVNGRLQPLESAARNALLIIRGKQTALIERRERLSAVEWLLTVTASPEVADRLPVFRVDHPELRSMLNLPANGSFNIAFRDIASHLETIQQHAERAGKTEPKDRTAFERAVVRLATGIAVYNKLKSSFRPDKSTNLVEELRHYEQAVAEGVAAWKARQNNLPYDEQTLRRLHDHLRHFESVIGSDHMLVVPPSNPSGGIHGWQTFGEALLGMLSTTNTPKPLLTYATLVTARMNNQPEIFNTALRDYRVWLNTLHPKLVFKCNLEYAYRNWQPFLKCMTLYGLGLLISLVGWYVWFKPLNSTAFWIAVCGFALHSAGIALRMAIEGRPPVTNLYSSAVFVGWGAAA